MVNNKQGLRFRQIHLDFHTSPAIPSVGEYFNGAEFAETLSKAHVNSVTCFARCHHGMLYYDSRRFPERVHPNLKNRNMLKEMIDECHKRDIRVPIYITIQWDQFTAREHPEWIAMDEHGCRIGGETFDAGFYRTLCVNTGYRDFLKEQIEELFTLLEVDGIFMDIVMQGECCCEQCLKKMRSEGIDVLDRQARIAYNHRMIDEFKEEISAYIRSFKPDAGIFYNTSHVGIQQKAVINSFTHLELESLPGGDWGYIDFPVTMRYARTLGLDCVTHTGRFHTEWGDFHSFKNAEAYEYECFRMLALGSRCLIGDQMEPCGKLSAPVYEEIGRVYGEVEQVEDWCRNVTPAADLAVLTPEEFTGGSRGNLSDSLVGVENLLDKLAVQFDIIDSEQDFTRYPLLLLPDVIPVNETLHRKLQEYLAGGGRVIASYLSGLDETGENVIFTEMGISLTEQTRDREGRLVRGRLTNQNEYIDYLLPEGELGRDLPHTEHVMYAKGTEIQAAGEGEVLSWFVKPYFDRSYEHYCSHRQTPSSGEKGNPGAVRNGNIIYLASPVFLIYQDRAPRWCRTLIRNCLDILLPDRWVSHNGPSTTFVALNHQEAENRSVLHILHTIPEKICNKLQTVEDVIPLYDLEVKVKWLWKKEQEAEIGAVTLVPQMEKLPFICRDSYVEFKVPKIEGHQIVEIVYS